MKNHDECFSNFLNKITEKKEQTNTFDVLIYLGKIEKWLEDQIFQYEDTVGGEGENIFDHSDQKSNDAVGECLQLIEELRGNLIKIK